MREVIATLKSLYEGISGFFFVKLFPSIILPVAGFLFGVENNLILGALFGLVVIDFITGIVSAYMSGQTIRSKMAVRSAFKVAVYGLLVSAGHLTEMITPGTTFIEETVMTFLALTELISVIENIGKMGYAIPKKLLSKLHKFRDEESLVTESVSTKVVQNHDTGTTETHTVTEKVEEKHVVETPKG